jgi:hypothetical protein
MRRLLWVLPLALFFLNPSLACGPPEPQFSYGAGEMRAAVEGSWSFSIAPDDGSAIQMATVRLQQSTRAAPTLETMARAPALVRAAYACGERTLVRSAGACVDISTMPLDVTVLASDPVLPAVTSFGTFRVEGLDFFVGELELMVGPYQILMEVAADGSFLNARVGPNGAAGYLNVAART